MVHNSMEQLDTQGLLCCDVPDLAMLTAIASAFCLPSVATSEADRSCSICHTRTHLSWAAQASNSWRLPAGNSCVLGHNAFWACHVTARMAAACLLHTCSLVYLSMNAAHL